MQGETAARILQTANQLIVERGYSAFSYADIAEAVDIRKASIHHHFATKAELVAAVLQQHRERLLAAMEHLDAQFADPADRIRAYVRYWEGCIRDRTAPFCIAALLGAELPSLPEAVQAEVQEHFAALAAWLERNLRAGAKFGTLRLQASAAVEAQLLMAVVHGAMLSARATGTCEVFHTVTRAALARVAAPKQ
jgi:TetR/AcrR family transcriptional regulator, transcriptional repressor for nem operon